MHTGIVPPLTLYNDHGLDVWNFIKKLGFPEEMEDELVWISYRNIASVNGILGIVDLILTVGLAFI